MIIHGFLVGRYKMFGIGDIIKISEFLAKKVSEIKNGFEADDSFKLADRYYQKGIIDLALVSIDKAIEKNENSNAALFRLHILKGDLLIEKGMQLYQSKVKFQSCLRGLLKNLLKR